MSPLLTVSDAVSVLVPLGYVLSERQVRYLDIEPSIRGVGLNGGRLYSAEDAYLLAVFAELQARCRRWELPVWSARAAIRYRDAELRRAYTARGPQHLEVNQISGATRLVTEANTATIDLRRIAERVTIAVQKHRATYPEVWTGAAYVPVDELVAV